MFDPNGSNGPLISRPDRGRPTLLWLVGTCDLRYIKRWGPGLAVRGSPRRQSPHRYPLSDLGLAQCSREALPPLRLSAAYAIALSTMVTGAGSSTGQGEGKTPIPSLHYRNPLAYTIRRSYQYYILLLPHQCRCSFYIMWLDHSYFLRTNTQENLTAIP